ncbi:MAG: IS1 family transposase [Nitrososphaerota archaeon]|nr:IS1 family transposase [Nitrososphaerota archaeon]
MWFFVGVKSHQCWLWWSWVSLQDCFSICFGAREHKYLDELRSLFAPFKLNIVYCDDTFVYKARLFVCVVKTLSVIRSVLSVSVCFCVLGVVGLFEGVLFF